MRISYDMFTHEWKVKWLVISTILQETKDFSRSEPVSYTVNVEISRKRCQIESLLPTQTAAVGE